MKSKLIGSMEALDNFQFVTINGKVVFEDKDKVVRIARAYSQVVKSAIKPLFDGKSVDELTKEFYNILPNYIYLETALKQAKTITDGLLEREEERGEIIHARIRKFWFASRGTKAIKGTEISSSTFWKTTWKLKLKTLGVSGFMQKHISARSTCHCLKN